MSFLRAPRKARVFKAISSSICARMACSLGIRTKGTPCLKFSHQLISHQNPTLAIRQVPSVESMNFSSHQHRAQASDTPTF